MTNLKIKKRLSYALLMALTMLWPSCKSETELTQQELVTAQLVADGDSWEAGSVTIDEVDESGLFDHFSIKFTEQEFTTENGGVVWPSSGTWSFTSPEAASFKRGDGLEVLIESIGKDELGLSLEWDQTTLDVEGGKVVSRKGRHRFKFRRRK